MLDNISTEFEAEIGSKNVTEINRITEKLVKDALNRMKANKRDAIFNTVSDCYINGPPQLLTHLTSMIKMYVQHGSVPEFILLCTLIPLVKDNLGDITN